MTGVTLNSHVCYKEIQARANTEFYPQNKWTALIGPRACRKNGGGGDSIGGHARETLVRE